MRGPEKSHRDVESGPKPFDLSVPVKFPFEIGQLVKHRGCDEGKGVVTAMILCPNGCVVEVSWGPGQIEHEWHFALERHYGINDDDEYEASFSHSLPWEFGTEARHRGHLRERGIVTGYKLSERGVLVRMSWGADRWDWHYLCELDVLERA